MSGLQRHELQKHELQRRREARETEKDIQFLVDADWSSLSDELRGELNDIIASADGLEREEFKHRLRLFSKRLEAAKTRLLHG
jgi:hypothetical protein